jgi:hypothetical protein
MNNFPAAIAVKNQRFPISVDISLVPDKPPKEMIYFFIKVSV